MIFTFFFGNVNNYSYSKKRKTIKSKSAKSIKSNKRNKSKKKTSTKKGSLSYQIDTIFVIKDIEFINKYNEQLILEKQINEKLINEKKIIEKSQNSSKKLNKSTNLSTTLSKKTITQQQIDTNNIPTYFNLEFKRGRIVNSAHIIKIPKKYFNNIDIIKANNTVRDLKKLAHILEINDTLSLFSPYFGGVNASFWRAYTNTPIGPTFIGGEPIELNTYKNWSSTFFDQNNSPYIGNFEVNASVTCFNLCEFQINNVNKRSDTNGVVLYNNYYGAEIPYISNDKLDKLLEETVTSFNDALELQDSTEQEFDIEQFRTIQKELEQSKNIENNLIKLAFEYLEAPVINKSIKAKVISKNSGVVPLNKNGFVISFGKDFPIDLMPKLGEIVNLNFNTNIYQDVIFKNSVSATPRLVTEGIAKHQAYEEGSKGRRFISKDLPRTAIGYDENKENLFLVCFEATDDQGHRGVSLEKLSILMKLIGCYDAMNLDGGGSSNMIVKSKNKVRSSSIFNSRKISVGIGLKSTKY